MPTSDSDYIYLLFNCKTLFCQTLEKSKFTKYSPVKYSCYTVLDFRWIVHICAILHGHNTCLISIAHSLNLKKVAEYLTLVVWPNTLYKVITYVTTYSHLKCWMLWLDLIYNLPSSSRQMPFFPTGAHKQYNTYIHKIIKYITYIHTHIHIQYNYYIQ